MLGSGISTGWYGVLEEEEHRLEAQGRTSPQPPGEDVMCGHYFVHKRSQYVCQLDHIADQVQLEVLLLAG